MNQQTSQWREMDFAHAWHPFTRQSEWTDDRHQPIFIEKGEGVWLIDTEGRRYIDGNASIWTNIHGHAHPAITRAMQQQLEKIAHSSFLGFSHPLAAELAQKLSSFFPEKSLQRVFFSDDGSTAIECAVKMSLQYHAQNENPQRVRFLTFDNSYHGDTLGAASLGGVSRFTQQFGRFGLESQRLSGLAELLEISCELSSGVAAVVIEPLIQGVNEMHLWEKGMLRAIRQWCDEHGVHLICDEVMTGFGRTGEMFACHHEGVTPDFLCIAKGLSGGYVPLAATLTTEEIYCGFLGDSSRAFYYGHSFTANPLGCSAALASLKVFEDEKTLIHLKLKISHLTQLLHELQVQSPFVYETRQCGMIAGIELRQVNGQKFLPEERVGERICHIARQHGLLTRPILDTIVFLPPLSITPEEMNTAFKALTLSLQNFHGKG